MTLLPRSPLLLAALAPLALVLAAASPLLRAGGAGVGGSAASGQRDEDARAQEPEDWRDRSKPELRAKWDALEGRPAPSLEALVDWRNAESPRWADLRGRVVLLDFWATWCPPCREEIPKLQALYRTHAEDGFVALGVHAPRGREALGEFVDGKGLTYAFAADPDGAFYERFGVEAIPTYMVVDRRGVVRVAGANRAKLAEIVTALLAEPAPAPDEVPPADWPPIVEKPLFATNDLRGKPAPELAFGQWLTDAPELQGRAVLVDFWATWCPPCRKAIPDLNGLHERFGEDLVVIGLSKEDPAVVRAFADDTPMHYALACDPSGKLSDAVGVEGIPHALLVSSDGIVRWQGFPLLAEDPLTAAVVARVLDSDAGVAARRKARAEAEAKGGEDPSGGADDPGEADGDDGGDGDRGDAGDRGPAGG